MSQHYSDQSREEKEYALPDVEVFELNATEVAELDEDNVHEYLKRFPLATMNSLDRENMLDAMVEELGITGGWFYWFCFPGCVPDSSPFGPFETHALALADAQQQGE